MNNVLIIPGTYKSTVTSSIAGDIITQQYKDIRPFDSITQVCISDGGEGTLETFSRNFGGKNRFYMVHGMRGEPIVTNTLWLNDTTVIIESATVIGYSLVCENERNPWSLSSFGIGELLLLTKKDGAKVIYVTMGDSSIMDIGIGMLRALGVEFLDERNCLLDISDLSDIEKIRTINIDKMDSFWGIEIFALVDTKDYLFGEYGQTMVYGAQKGLHQKQSEIVENGFRNYARIIYDMFAIELSSIPMTTGSGGLAASLHAILNADLIHCPLYIAERIGLKKSIANANIIITGEGFLDNQTRWGKIPHFVSQGFDGHIFLIVGDCSNEGINDIKNVSQATIHVIKLNSDAVHCRAMANATIQVCNEIDKISK